MLRFMLIVCLILFVATVQAFAQQPKEDVVHLKNGSVVHGTITELIPGKLQLKIQTRDKNLFVYKMEEIAKISIGQKGDLNYQSYQKRDPWIAFGLSFILPGGGQVYNKHYGKGAVLFTATIIGAIVLSKNGGGDLIGGTKEDYEAIYDDLVDFGPDDGPFVLGAVLGIGGYLYSVIDAPKSANKINQQGGYLSYGHLIEFDGDRTTLGIDPVVSRNKFGSMLTLHW